MTVILGAHRRLSREIGSLAGPSTNRRSWPRADLSRKRGGHTGSTFPETARALSPLYLLHRDRRYSGKGLYSAPSPIQYALPFGRPRSPRTRSGVTATGRKGKPSNVDTGFMLGTRLALRPAEAG